MQNIFSTNLFATIALTLFLNSCWSHAAVLHETHSKIQLSTGTRQEVFADGKYVLDYEVDIEEQVIYFNVTVETLGFVGLGISPSGVGMTDADIFIGGVNEDGTPYSGDYYATANARPILDDVQHWELLAYGEEDNHTMISISRPLNSCDDQDVAINNDTLYFIWAFGDDDNIGYHDTNRGGVAANILDPPMPPADVSKFDVWTLRRNVSLPVEDTVYWCTIHKRPALNGVHHVVGFSPDLVTPEALKHTHHFIVSKCVPPEGVDADEFFGQYVDTEGGDCYEKPHVVPSDYCGSYLYVWAIGGKPLFFPENIGYPVNEAPGHEYVMFEIHYDNPDNLENVNFEAAVDIYYTPEKREFEAELLMVSHAVAPSHIIPPQSEAFTTVGHCSANCLTSRLPESGINIFNVLLHSHKAGRKLTLRHFRDNEELPWVANDNHYLFDYQQNRPLRQEVKLLPGDHLSYECVTNTEGIDTVTIGGLSTRHEMCQTFAWYYPRQNLVTCSSSYYYMDRIYETFGIHNMTNEFDNFDPTVTAPPEFANKLYSQVLSEYDWQGHPELKFELQQELRFEEHLEICRGPQDDESKMGGIMQEDFPKVTYPSFRETYVPPNPCTQFENGTTPEVPSSEPPTTTDLTEDPSTSTETPSEPPTTTDLTENPSTSSETSSEPPTTTDLTEEPSTSPETSSESSTPPNSSPNTRLTLYHSLCLLVVAFAVLSS